MPASKLIFSPFEMQVPNTRVFVEAITDYEDAWFDDLLPQLPKYRREKAERMRFPEGKKTEAMAGILLRAALYGYGLSDEEVKVSGQGRPFIQLMDGREPAFFSISHSGPVAAVAISGESRLGFDIEEIKTGRKDIAERFFKPGENELLKKIAREPGIGENAADLAFIRLWTCKEAYGKLKGDGLQAGLSFSAASLLEAGNDEDRFIWEDGKKIAFYFGQYEKGGRTYLITLAREVT